MKRGMEYLLLIIAATLLCGCGPVESPTIMIPTYTETTTPTTTLAVTPTHDAKASVSTKAAVTRSAMQTNVALTPTITPTVGVPLETMMQFFPLEVGTIWLYRVTIEYNLGVTFTEDGEAIEPRWRTWTGLVTQRVKGRTETPQSDYPTFIISLEGFPRLTADGIVAENQISKISVKNDCIYDGERRWIKWPLEVGAFWDPRDAITNPQEPGPEVWYVLDTESVETGIGTLDDCFFIQLGAPPETTSNWIFPGIGVARIYGWQGGTQRLIYEWVLEFFSTPAQ